MAKYDAANPAALKRLVSSGTKLQPFSPAIMDACYKAAIETHNEVAATNADFKKVLEAMLAFRNDEYLWWQVAEYSYDSYMIRARTRG
jgi:TRAP-type mannitol/chloroaromatic compound transport system substrate-binding protein